MSSIDGMGGPSPSQGMGTQSTGVDSAKEKDCDEGGFRSALSRVAGGVSRVAGAIPGGTAVSLTAEGVSRLAGGSSDELSGAQSDQLEQMFEMQEQSQAFNMQYLELQNQMQADNRRFSTLSNLMKVRHDTAKSAINNMHA